MLKLRILYLFVLLLTTSSIYAVKISGYVGNCKGKELKIQMLSNFITREFTTLDSCIVDEDNCYEFVVNQQDISVCFIDLGQYDAQLIVDTSHDLSVNLPDYAPLTKKEYLNLYFKKESVLLYDEQFDDMNFHIKELEFFVTKELKNVMDSENPQFAALASIDSVEQKLKDLECDFLRNYLTYTSSILYQFAHPERINLLKELFLQDTEVDLSNPAYTNLFLSEYINPFIASDGLFYSEVSDAILNQKLSEDFIDNIASMYSLKNVSVAELLSVKGFYSATLQNDNYQKDIVKLMEQLESLITTDEIKKLCRSTRLYIEKMMVGSPAPYYELNTIKDRKAPTILRRKEILLSFVNTNIYDCQRHLQLLKEYKEIYKREIEVIVVCVHQNPQELERFFRRNKFDNLYFVLPDNENKILDDYNVKILPSYYFIDKEGCFAYSPMSSPEEDMLYELQQYFGY